MPIKTDLVNGRYLKVGSIFSLPEYLSFYKITEMSVSKPGKHGATKIVFTAKHIVSGKTLAGTFKDNEKLIQVLDFDYLYKVIYSFIDGEINTNLDSGENIYVQNFIPEDQKRLTKTLDEFIKTRKGFIDDSGAPLVIKYSDMEDPFNALVFWELLYIPKAELSKYGIDNFSL